MNDGSAARSAGANRGFSLLIKPASADCNLRCDYCFYLPKAGLYSSKVHRMAPEVLERLVCTYLATSQTTYGFSWQGGEPALMGTDFYREVTRLQRRYARPGAIVGNSLQTNATLVDERLARHLARYRFLVGVSLDGPADMHDRHRRGADGSPSHARVLEGVGHLRRHGVEHNVLVLVNSTNVGHGGQIYTYLVDQGFLYHQYIPCVNLGPEGEPDSHTVRPADWAAFLREVYELWRFSDTRRVSIRLFDSVLAHLVGDGANICTMGRDCRQYFVVEHNGDVYPCDFYVDRKLLLGNVMTHTWEELVHSPRYASFGRRKARLPSACRSCTYLPVCGGDCPRHRPGEGGDPNARSYLCPGWKAFFAQVLPGLTSIAKSITRERRKGSASR